MSKEIVSPTAMAARQAKTKCTVRDRDFIEPCDSLKEVAEGRAYPGRRCGIFWLDLTNLETHKPSRTFFIVKSSSHPKGVALNFCPFCGTQIDSPFTEPEDGEGAAQ